MIKWMRQFWISSALDRAQPRSPARGQGGVQSKEGLDFAQELELVHGLLKTQRPMEAAPPAGLHAAIMQRVRGSVHEEPAADWIRAWLKPATVSALVAALGGFLLLHKFSGSPVPEPSLTSAATALDLGENAAQALPSALVAPLASELQNVNRDLQNTARFLLSSVP